MDENEKINFAGTYFDRDSVLRLERIANLFAWAALAFYMLQTLLGIFVYFLQKYRGLIPPSGFTDVATQMMWMILPALPGLLYFVSIQAIGKFLLILMDIEDNLRRAARKK